MKKSMRLLASIFTIIFCLMTMMGCGKSSEQETSNTPTTTNSEQDDTETTDTSETTTEDTETVAVSVEPSLENYFYDYKPFDMGGRTITIGTWSLDGNISSGDPEPDPATATEKDLLIYKNLKRVEEKYNCKIKFEVVPQLDMAAKLTTSLNAGDSYCDIVRVWEESFVTAVAGDQLLTVEEYAYPESDLLNGNYYVTKLSPAFGKNYLAFHQMDINGSIAFLGYNQQIIDEYGLESPLDLYNKGEWTWDKMYDIIKTTTVDKDKDGVNDTYGFSGMLAAYPGFLESAIATNGGRIFDDINFKPTFDDPKTIEAYEFTKKVFNTENLTREYDGTVGNDWNKPWLWQDGNSAIFLIAPWMTPASSTLNFEWHAVPFPIGPSNPDGADYNKFMSHPDGYGVVKDCADPMKVWQIFEEYNAWFGTDLDVRLNGYIAWLQNNFFSEEDIDMLRSISNGKQLSGFHGGIPGYPYYDIATAAITTDQSVASAIESYKQNAQSVIDDIEKSFE